MPTTSIRSRHSLTDRGDGRSHLRPSRWQRHNPSYEGWRGPRHRRCPHPPKPKPRPPHLCARCAYLINKREAPKGKTQRPPQASLLGTAFGLSLTRSSLSKKLGLTYFVVAVILCIVTMCLNCPAIIFVFNRLLNFCEC